MALNLYNFSLFVAHLQIPSNLLRFFWMNSKVISSAKSLVNLTAFVPVRPEKKNCKGSTLIMGKLVAFLSDVKIELARVSWPSRKQTIQYTLVVIGMSLVVAAFLGVLDAVFSFILNKFIL